MLRVGSAPSRVSCPSTPHPTLLLRRPPVVVPRTFTTATMAAPAPKHTNRLSREKSPYLLQHQHNPVDWYPWGHEAFSKARQEDKPIFLSVGYSTCHWCHVMERESFENEEVAAIMNEHFVNIKVDREERPDVDKIYMTYVQALTGGGGWPMSVFITPSLHPIVGGTYLPENSPSYRPAVDSLRYYPPEDRYGRTGFKSLLRTVSRMWKEKKEQISEQGKRIMELISEQTASMEAPEGKASKNTLVTCYKLISKSYEPRKGGFTSAPKFPRPVIFNFLFHFYLHDPLDTVGRRSLDMCLFTLQKMGEGGIHDHIGGGFHRYSVDGDWHVPHFEKMLYDQGQLACSYLDAYQITKRPIFEQYARDILEYVRTTITSPEGGIYSAEDADSYAHEGAQHKEEGAFYVWTEEELNRILGQNAQVFNHHFGVRATGNCSPESDPHGELKGKNVLIQRHSLEDTAKQFSLSVPDLQRVLAECRVKLFEHRQKRPRPHLDDKIIVAWNGLMISAYARAYQVLRDPLYLETGKRALNFIRQTLYKDGVLIRNYREGASNVPGFSSDYAFLIQALLDMYEASFEVTWLHWASELQAKQDELYWDAKAGGYFSSAANDPTILVRLKEEYDGAEPSENSVSALNLLRLSQYFDSAALRDKAEKTMTCFGKHLEEAPIVMPQMCVALDFSLAKPTQIVIAGPPNDEATIALVKEVHQHYLPNKILIAADGGDGQHFLSQKLGFLSSMQPVGGKPAAFVCQNYACQLPLTEPAKLGALLSKST